MKDKLEIAKKVITEYYKDAPFGIFDRRNILCDPMSTIYNEDGLVIDICYRYGYFEVFGLNSLDFWELEQYYNQLRKRRLKNEEKR